jgi:hypothetical protein
VAFGYWSIDLVTGLLIRSAHFKGAGMSEQSEALKERTMLFAISVLRLIDQFPDTPGARVIAFQLANVQHLSARTIARCATLARARNSSRSLEL